MSSYKTIVYLDKDLLETVVIFPEEYPMLYRLFSSYSEICIDMTDDELDAIFFDDHNELKHFFVSEHIKVIPLPGYLAQLKEMPRELISRSRCIYFLNVSKDEANRLSNQYGVIVKSSQSIDDNLFGYSFKRAFFKDASDTNGWDDFFRPIHLCPTNSIVIKDKHLFANEFGSIGEENILSLLKRLMPSTFSDVFQILIVSNLPGSNKNLCNQIVGRLKSELKNCFQYEIELEVFFFRSEIHKRRIFMGYQTIDCDKGFCVFKSKNNHFVVREDNEFEIMPMFNLSMYEGCFGDSQYYIDSRDLRSIRLECINAGKRYSVNKKDPSVHLCGDYDKTTCLSLNRLLKSVD